MTSRLCARARSMVQRDPRGVTLLELVIAMSLLFLALGSIYSIVAVGARSARVTNDFVQSQAQVRSALDNVVDEIRWAQSVLVASESSVTLLIPHATPFSTGSPYVVTFAYDAAADAVTRQVDPDAGGPLPAGAATPLAYAVVRADGSAGLAFEYFDAAGTSLGTTPADPSGIARIRLAVTTTRNRVSRTFAGDSALRGR